MMYKGPMEEEKSSNKNHWHGFCIDLLDEISNSLGFNYTIHPVADGNYGVGRMINGKEVWDGIIGELQSQVSTIRSCVNFGENPNQYHFSLRKSSRHLEGLRIKDVFLFSVMFYNDLP